jgi:hypothetical protein
MCGSALAGDARQPRLRLRCDKCHNQILRPDAASNRGNFPSLNSWRPLGLWKLRKAKQLWPF